MRISRWLVSLVLIFVSSSGAAEPVPPFSGLMKPLVLRKVIEDRAIQVHARLDENHYSFYAAMLVRAEPELTRRILTDYQLYPKMVPYVNRAAYSPKTQILALEGGLWKFQVISSIHFEEKGPRWIRFKIVEGHFKGLAGDIFFEPQGERGTAVFMRGDQVAAHWPPKFLIERGAEIVFGFTAQRMRSYIETQKKAPQPEPKGSEVSSDPGVIHDAGKSQLPTPRAHL